MPLEHDATSLLLWHEIWKLLFNIFKKGSNILIKKKLKGFLEPEKNFNDLKKILRSIYFKQTSSILNTLNFWYSW